MNRLMKTLSVGVILAGATLSASEVFARSIIPYNGTSYLGFSIIVTDPAWKVNAGQNGVDNNISIEGGAGKQRSVIINTDGLPRSDEVTVSSGQRVFLTHNTAVPGYYYNLKITPYSGWGYFHTQGTWSPDEN